MSKRVMVVVTINRVQDLYTNPVYRSARTATAPHAADEDAVSRTVVGAETLSVGVTGEDGDVEHLQRLLEWGRQLDESRCVQARASLC